MKILALDLGDKWVGSAMSDTLGILARPHQTTTAKELIPFLHKTIAEYSIKTIVVGYPKTMKGLVSEQTQKVIDQVENLKKLFPTIKWVLWDERLTSKQADQIKRGKNKEDKIKSHSLAAALVLEGFLMYARNQNIV
ncbi:MAG: hypothetical protein UR26_C0001G0145 [candidate division TM6 bacterium GW2011_GWF2_32_72]|nr:MAG: hypothetical protein UR26_C0001G0145 [candidate division TM6 bacterium GW2011_GWF2_32_72]